MKGFTNEAIESITDRFLELDEVCQRGAVLLINEDHPDLAIYLNEIMKLVKNDAKTGGVIA